MKIFKFLFVIPVITLIIIFQTSVQNRYLMASDIRDGETIFRNVCAGCHVTVSYTHLTLPTTTIV